MKIILFIIFLLAGCNSKVQELDQNSWGNTLDPIVITTEEIASGKLPVLIVYHEEGHGGWQLYDGSNVLDKKPFVLPKDEALILDPTLQEIIDLPVGWKAVRENIDSKWVREKL